MGQIVKNIKNEDMCIDGMSCRYRSCQYHPYKREYKTPENIKEAKKCGKHWERCHYWRDEGDKLCLWIESDYDYEEPFAEINKKTLEYSINQQIFDPIFRSEGEEYTCPEAYPYIEDDTIWDVRERVERHIKFDIANMIKELGAILVNLSIQDDAIERNIN